MISMMRCDDRLIHGQVALLWSKELQLSRIIVASDQAAKSDIQKNALLLAAPAGIKVAVVPVAKAIELANDPRGAKLKMLLLTNTVANLKTLVDNVDVETKVDIANVGRIGGGNLNDKHKISETVYLTDDEVEAVKAIGEKRNNFVYQPLPSDTPVPFLSLLKGE
ncbi:PTS system mannose/fructose/N-acetylgalactosamine-transporter subunit IIB [Lacticaseibacillus suibinensis]|uniref:PTS system mannose/fructose/N-acetylgalactosamine-transporter subunit IIB n=1 Tax=Lacticaseibacillus suibinensis TaxID=2486011 RepID=UPI000F776F97|nr:PTS sugar transporter subunit IIB [Lacticaseibacillus suibinensis]